MKKIFLIGDSIRYGFSDEARRNLGYGIHIREKLAGKAEVYYPNDNCRFLQYTLRYLHEWARVCPDRSQIDIVHWNNGLWDAARYMDEEALTPIPMYRELLLRVHGRIRTLFPNAKIYFSLSTPVIEEQAPRINNRTNGEIQGYNRAAREVLEPLGVEIIDLYSAAKPLQPEHSYDWVHYTPTGAAILADYIISRLDLT